MGTILQVGLAFANTMNIGGAADMITNYGLSGQLASGGLIAASTGAYYSMTQRKTASTMATGAGAVAGGISGTLGTAITQAIGWTRFAEGTTQIINFTALGTQFMGLIGMADAVDRHRPDVRPGGADASVRHDGRRRRHRRAARPHHVRQPRKRTHATIAENRCKARAARIVRAGIGPHRIPGVFAATTR